MKKIAIIKDGKVENIIKVEDSWTEEGKVIVDITEIPDCSIGYDYVDGNFVNNLAPALGTIITTKLERFHSVAPALLRELYVANTLAGITTAQSDEMFDTFSDVLVRIREGAFPTALYRLQQKTPSGFVTQELIDVWIAKIQSYLV